MAGWVTHFFAIPVGVTIILYSSKSYLPQLFNSHIPNTQLRKSFLVAAQQFSKQLCWVRLACIEMWYLLPLKNNDADPVVKLSNFILLFTISQELLSICYIYINMNH